MWYTTYFELHSQATRLQRSNRPTRPPPERVLHPLRSLHSSGVQAAVKPEGYTYTRHLQTGEEPEGLRAGLIRFHSPLLTESLLVSFPPLTDMLKFSG